MATVRFVFTLDYVAEMLEEDVADLAKYATQ